MSAEEQKQADNTQAQHAGGTPDAATTHPPKISGGATVLVVVVLLIVAVALGIFGVLERRHKTEKLEKYTDTTAAPPVSLEKPVKQQSAREIVLPGNIQAYMQAPIYARTTGYVKAWYHDIGSHVNKGDLLAVIETPELDQQLVQAKADLATATSAAGLAKTTADRYTDLVGKEAVSQQDTDNAVNQLEGRNTQVAAAAANVHRLEGLQAFERIEAPFSGVITARNIDVGQLISPSGSTTASGTGANSNAKEIFDIAAVGTLRVFVNVPQIYSPDAKTGTPATLTLPQYPGRKFPGRLVRSSNAVDPATRMLLAEVDVDNKSGELLPGSYTEVHLDTSIAAPALIVPVTALILEPDGMHIATVDENHRVHMVRIALGRDLGTSAEVLSGLGEHQQFIPNPPDSLTDGEEVRVVAPPAANAPDAAPEKK